MIPVLYFRNGTSMISLIIPPKDQISRIAKMLADEFGTASNIKSRVNRLSVLGAITSVQQRLKLYNKGDQLSFIILFNGVFIIERIWYSQQLLYVQKNEQWNPYCIYLLSKHKIDIWCLLICRFKWFWNFDSYEQVLKNILSVKGYASISIYVLKVWFGSFEGSLI